MESIDRTSHAALFLARFIIMRALLTQRLARHDELCSGRSFRGGSASGGADRWRIVVVQRAAKRCRWQGNVVSATCSIGITTTHCPSTAHHPSPPLFLAKIYSRWRITRKHPLVRPLPAVTRGTRVARNTPVNLPSTTNARLMSRSRVGEVGGFWWGSARFAGVSRSLNAMRPLDVSCSSTWTKKPFY